MGRNSPFLAGPVKLKKSKTFAESTFNPGAEQLPSPVSLRLMVSEPDRCEEGAVNSTDAKFGFREFNSPTRQPGDFRELALYLSSLGNDGHQSTHKVYNSQ